MPLADYTESGEDTVVARLEFEIPDDADIQVRELQKSTSLLQGDMEGLARYSGLYLQNLESAREAQEALQSYQVRGEQMIRDGGSQGFVDGGGRIPPMPGYAPGIEPAQPGSTPDFGEGVPGSGEDSSVRTPTQGESAQIEQGVPVVPAHLQESQKTPEGTDGKPKETKEERALREQSERIANLRESLESGNLDEEMESIVQRRLDLEGISPGEAISLAQERNLLKTELRDGRVVTSFNGIDTQEMINEGTGLPKLLDQVSSTVPGENSPQLSERVATFGQMATSGADLLTATTAQGGIAAGGRLAAAGGLSGALPYLGAAGAVLGAGMVVTNEVTRATELGRIQGGGVDEGLDHRATIQTMALNPFITNDQARQIVMSGLQGGYSGDAFESVTDFMAKNLSEMNIQVADSVALLKKNVEGGGASVEQLGAQLSLLQDIAGDNGLSMDRLAQDYTNISGQLVDQGMGGGEAGQLAISIASSFPKGPLQERGTTIVSSMLSPQTGFGQMLATALDVRPGDLTSVLEGKSPEEVNQLVTQQLQQIYEMSRGDKVTFHGMLQQNQLSLTRNESDELFDMLARGETVFGQGVENMDEQTKKDLTDQGSAHGIKRDRMSKGAREVAGGFEWGEIIGDASGIRPLVKGVQGLATGEFDAKDNFWYKIFNDGYVDKDQIEKGVNTVGAGMEGGAYYEGLERIAENYGSNEVDVILEDGSRMSVQKARTTPGLDLTKARFVMSGGDESEALDYSSFIHTTQEGEEGTGDTNVTIDLTDDAKKLIKVTGLENKKTPHKEKADQGAEGRRANNPPVGED